MRRIGLLILISCFSFQVNAQSWTLDNYSLSGNDTNSFSLALVPVHSDDSSAVTSSLLYHDTSAIKYDRLAIVGGLLAGAMVSIHIYQQNGWWADNRTSFHFQEDLIYGRSVDKIGHFYGASLMTFAVKKAVQWANVNERDALWMGAGASVLFQTYVEIEDGFSTWGFDRVDFAADVAGAAWPLAQYYFPLLQNIDLKMSYLPSDLIDNAGGVGFKGQKHLMMDDYEGQTFWLSIKINCTLPAETEKYWPDFLNLAVGYGARDIAATSTQPYSVVYVALDYDMTKIIPQSSPFLRTLSQTLNFIHFPAPAVRIAPSAIWYGLYF